jgi:hypothetical protein
MVLFFADGKLTRTYLKIADCCRSDITSNDSAHGLAMGTQSDALDSNGLTLRTLSRLPVANTTAGRFSFRTLCEMSRFGYPDCEHPRDPQSTEVNGQEYNQAHVRTPFVLNKQPEEIGGKGTANHERRRTKSAASSGSRSI